MEEGRIYVVVAGTIQTPKNVLQPAGRQIAQACHVVSKLRHKMLGDKKELIVPGSEFEPVTTIILQCRDSAELSHNFFSLRKRHLKPEIFSDNNPEYGPGNFPTVIAVFATKKQIAGILDYLPLWGLK